jgi:regulator of sigma E protease
VSAGPIANFLFAIFAFWLMFVTRDTALAPMIGDIDPQSIAGQAGLKAGDEIIKIDNRDVTHWQDANLALVRRIGESGFIGFDVKTSQGDLVTRQLPISNWMADQDEPRPFNSLGLTVWRPKVIPQIDQLAPEGRALQSGLNIGDILISANGDTIETWSAWVHLIKESPEKLLAITVQRNDHMVDLWLTPKEKYDEKGNRRGYIGAGVKSQPWPEDMIRHTTLGPIDAVGAGLAKTWDMVTLTLDSVKKMLTGLLSVKNLSGPITIAKVADASIESGLEAFLAFLAYVSISLGVLNLLPIPVLDGGHLLFYIIEAIKGSPVSEKIQTLSFQFGLVFIFGLMALAIFNDIGRL